MAAVLDLNLAYPGGVSGDGSPDTVEVAGTPAADQIIASHDGDALEMSGVPNRVRVSGADRSTDRVVVDADLGADVLRTNPIVGELDVGTTRRWHWSGHVRRGRHTSRRHHGGRNHRQPGSGRTGRRLRRRCRREHGRQRAWRRRLRCGPPRTWMRSPTSPLNGGPGTDSVTGGDGDELLIGGDGNDQVIGKGGDDVLLLGADQDNTFWFAGDGNDIVRGWRRQRPATARRR